MADTLIVSGSGPYADPWHDFAQTSGRLADILRGLGHRARIVDDVEAGLSRPGPCDLLVVNIGNPAAPRPPERSEAVRRGIADHLGAGRALLAIHFSLGPMSEMSEWPATLGGRWVPSRSMHPPQSLALVQVVHDGHPIVADLHDFEVYDERYSYLETHDDIAVLAVHEYDGARHPLVWAREDERSRVVYDALGHDVRSYESSAHVELLERSVRWLLGHL